MNSLTANNRLSQQVAPVVYERQPLRHECRLSNGLVVSNHREHYLTVGDDSCRNLTAGFVTGEGFMSMSLGGSQKQSELSTCAKDTRMSVLVLCGNSGVTLLSVKHQQGVDIDSAISGRYTVQAPYKAGAGIGTPELIKAIYDAPASFLSSALTHARIMVGWAGEPKGSPVSLITGSSNPVQFTTSEIGTSGGGSFSPIKEAAIMATIPALTQPEISIINGLAVTSSLAVACYFSKRHDDVLKKIRTLDCSPEFCARNFAETSISVNQPNGGTRKLPCYYISRPTLSLSALLKQHGIRITANQVYHQLAKLGIVEHRERYSRTGINGIKKFWSLTAKGCMFGKNITSPANPRETQPHFFESRFPELLKLLETVH